MYYKSGILYLVLTMNVSRKNTIISQSSTRSNVKIIISTIGYEKLLKHLKFECYGITFVLVIHESQISNSVKNTIFVKKSLIDIPIHISCSDHNMLLKAVDTLNRPTIKQAFTLKNINRSFSKKILEFEQNSSSLKLKAGRYRKSIFNIVDQFVDKYGIEYD